MDQFTYLADPNASLRLAHQRYQDEVRRAAWRQAQALERRQRASLASQPVSDEIVSKPALGWLSRFSWRTALRPTSGATG